MKAYSTMIDPIFYKGYIIQPGWDGRVYVHDREDKSYPEVRRFDCVDCAEEWIDKEVDK